MQDEALLQQLDGDIDIARQLLELAEQEFQALSERDLAKLEGILSQTQPLLALLGQHGNLRSQWLGEQGLSPNRAGLQQLVAKTALGSRILEQAGILEAALDACRAANERNGRLIRANRAAVGSMLEILQGSSTTPDLYDNRGGTAKTTQQRPLSQA
ncbi:FlgN family protein [Stutzerimonas stutzeri TS44]|nr:FlgN family protein [Stutzerimonas stutzeri TS44]